MKTTLQLTIAIAIVSLISLFFYFLASTDIYHDYLSKNSVSRFWGDVGDKLPGWTACPLEWQILQIDFFIRIVFTVMIIVVLIQMLLKYDKFPASK